MTRLPVSRECGSAPLAPSLPESLEGELECGALCGKSSKAQPPCNHAGCRSESGDADARRGSGHTVQCGWPRWLRDDVGAHTRQGVLSVPGGSAAVRSGYQYLALRCCCWTSRRPSAKSSSLRASTQWAAADGRGGRRRSRQAVSTRRRYARYTQYSRHPQSEMRACLGPPGRPTRPQAAPPPPCTGTQQYIRRAGRTHRQAMVEAIHRRSPGTARTLGGRAVPMDAARQSAPLSRIAL
jgi:hypothetical protein